MARPLRIEYPGAVYHVTSRGDRQEPIFQDDVDRQRLLEILDCALTRLDAEALAYCFMGNHYHLVVRTRQPNLSRVMRHVNGEYTRAFNRRHALTGHLFQGRFHSVVVDTDAYLMQVCRYVDLNPVRAGLISAASDWRWSSYRAHVGMANRPVWLATDFLHGYLLGRDVRTPKDGQDARRLYAESVKDGIGVDLWKQHLREEIFLGSEQFAADMRELAQRERMACVEISAVQRRPSASGNSLADWLAPDLSREESFRLAYSEGGLTMSEIAKQAGRSVSAVSRAIAIAEQAQNARPDTAKRKT